MRRQRDSPNLDQVAAAAARTFASVASIGLQDGHIEVFGVTYDGQLRHRWYTDVWSDWTPMPGPAAMRVTYVAAAAHGGWADLFVVSCDGHLHHRWWGEAEGWSDWGDWGGGFVGPVTAASKAVDHNEVWVHRSGALVHKWLQGNSWSDWHEFN